MAYHQGYQTPDQAAYQAGYDAGFRAGYQAAVAAQQQQHQQQDYQQHGVSYAPPPPAPGYQQGQYGYQQQQSAPPPQLPYRPGPPSIPPRPAPPSQRADAQQQQQQQQQQQHPQLSTREIWQPRTGTTFNYVLSHPINLSLPLEAEVYIVDLFDTPQASVAALRERGKKVVAYFSAGTCEDWRTDVKGLDKKKGVLGKAMDGWKGERWVDVRSEEWRGVVLGRLELAREKGFDGVDPDNVDGWENKNGVGLKRGDCVGFVKWLAGEAHRRGLACGLKNGGEEMVGELVGVVEFVVQEQACQWGDEDSYMPFVRAGKPVFHVEYPKGEDSEDKKMNDERRVEGRKREKAFKMRGQGWSSIVKNVSLDQWVQTE